MIRFRSLFGKSDRYKNFEDLAASEREGIDYSISFINRNSGTGVLVPHGGGIEPGTSEIGRAIAGSIFSLYLFEGIKSRNNSILHITSAAFDEPTCAVFAAAHSSLVSLHGCSGSAPAVHVGGLDELRCTSLIAALVANGIPAVMDTTHHAGKDARNITNTGVSGKGVQLELSAGLRKSMFADLSRQGRTRPTETFHRFVDTVRNNLENHD